MPYSPTDWVDNVTPVNAANMDKLEQQLASVTRFVDEWHDVRSYGAVGDGYVDDTEAIQDAIYACQAAEGGIVFLPSGRYKITAPLLITQHHLTLMGPGMGVSFDPGGPGDRGAAVLMPSGAAFAGSAVIRVCQTGTPVSALAGIVLRGFSIAGYSLPANVTGIYAEIQQSLVSEIRLDIVTGHGMHFRSVDPAGDGWANEIFHNFIYYPGSCGIYLQDAPDNRVTENTIVQSGSHCIWAPTAGTMIMNNLISGAGKGVLADLYDTKVIGNRIQDTNGGVYLSGGAFGHSGFEVVGNKIWNSSRAADNTTDSINITADVEIRGAGVIAGNAFWTNQGGANGGTYGSHYRARYHINIASPNIKEVAIGINSYGFNGAVRSHGTATINDDGTRTQIAPFVLAQSAVAKSYTGGTSLTYLDADVIVPGGLMGKDGRLRITSLWTIPNNANAKSMFVTFGGTSFYAISLTTMRTVQVVTLVCNRGSQSSQVGTPSAMAGPGGVTTDVVTAAFDTSVDQTVRFAVILGNAADTITLESYSVEVLPG